MFNMTDVGQRISVFRKNAGLTQMELANKLGISYQAVSNWERGISMPDISNLSALAEILSVSVDEIINDKKLTSILNDQEQDIENISLTPEEFNAVSPLLSCEKNRQLISNVKPDIASSTIRTEDGTVITVNDNKMYEDLNITSLGLTTEEIDDFARKAYESGRTGMFSLFVNRMSQDARKDICIEAFENGKTGIFSMLVGEVPQNTREQMYRRAFEENKVAIFSILNNYMPQEQRRKYLDAAISSGSVALSSILISSLKDRGDEDDDDEADD